ncbi:MAG TPA: hypothetical protein VFU13_22335 [Steroidobacteraceae bacterium]|nr:hypothetical protein [Steroidobacteraceae bacterium]
MRKEHERKSNISVPVKPDELAQLPANAIILIGDRTPQSLEVK